MVEVETYRGSKGSQKLAVVTPVAGRETQGRGDSPGQVKSHYHLGDARVAAAGPMT
jgi:hypothetical protein